MLVVVICLLDANLIFGVATNNSISAFLGNVVEIEECGFSLFDLASHAFSRLLMPDFDAAVVPQIKPVLPVFSLLWKSS